ncbi:MAG TPA: hypothetical protein VK277_14190 [Acidimicrobiales bacterium]|nr:hypothetical protein [Acidimicrobiales bacterium]
MPTRVRLPDDVAERLAAETARRGVSMDELAAELIAAGLPPKGRRASTPRHLEFTAAGASGSAQSGAEADEILAEGFGCE